MFNGKVRHWNPVTISIPNEQLSKLDDLRHDVSRSKYIQRIIQDHIRLMELSD
jgi:metal-responsive CopG/Arc/MetJ family transcriptional regulator